MLPLLLAVPAGAEEPAAVLQTTGPVVIDGRLEESDWQRATPITDFQRYLPTAGGPPDGETEVRFLQDGEHLYIGITVRGTSYPPRARISPREAINDDDQIGIYIDTFGDGRTGYIFYLNPLGIQQDIRYGNGSWYPQWDTVFSSEGQPTADGFVIEIAMPFRSLRYPDPDGTPQTWGVMLTRKLPHEGTKYSYPRVANNHPRMFTQAAALPGIQPAPRGAGLSIQPALTMRHQLTADEAGALQWAGLEPLNDTARPSLDLRLGLTPDLGLAFTANPDFSQVEGDVTQVNLNQRFAFTYPEQRPFFLDGIDAFSDPGSTLFTRSIVSPLYGAKLSGQEGPLSVGLLQSIDAQPGASIHESGTPGFSESDLTDALASNAIGRLRLDAFSSGSVGITLADKRILGSTGGYSDVLAADVTVPFSESWVASGRGAASIAGDDTESLSGGRAAASLSRSPALGTGGGLSVSETSPDYRQEMGVLNLSGIRSASAWLNHRIGQERSTWTPQLSASGSAERNGDRRLSVEHSQSAALSTHSLSAFGALDWWVEDAVPVEGYALGGGWSATLSRGLTLNTSAVLGQEIDYARSVPAQSVAVSGGGTLRPTTGTRLDIDIAQQWFTPQGQPQESFTRLYSRFNWQFLEPIGLRLIQQTALHSERATDNTLSALLTWMKVPGNEVYIGGSWGLVEDAGLMEQLSFAKVTHLWRL